MVFFLQIEVVIFNQFIKMMTTQFLIIQNELELLWKQGLLEKLAILTLLNNCQNIQILQHLFLLFICCDILNQIRVEILVELQLEFLAFDFLDDLDFEEVRIVDEADYGEDGHDHAHVAVDHGEDLRDAREHDLSLVGEEVYVEVGLEEEVVVGVGDATVNWGFLNVLGLD